MSEGQMLVQMPIVTSPVAVAAAPVGTVSQGANAEGFVEALRGAAQASVTRDSLPKDVGSNDDVQSASLVALGKLAHISDARLISPQNADNAVTGDQPVAVKARTPDKAVPTPESIEGGADAASDSTSSQGEQTGIPACSKLENATMAAMAQLAPIVVVPAPTATTGCNSSGATGNASLCGTPVTLAMQHSSGDALNLMVRSLPSSGFPAVERSVEKNVLPVPGSTDGTVASPLLPSQSDGGRGLVKEAPADAVTGRKATDVNPSVNWETPNILTRQNVASSAASLENGSAVTTVLAVDTVAEQSEANVAINIVPRISVQQPANRAAIGPVIEAYAQAPLEQGSVQGDMPVEPGGNVGITRDSAGNPVKHQNVAMRHSDAQTPEQVVAPSKPDASNGAQSETITVDAVKKNASTANGGEFSRNDSDSSDQGAGAGNRADFLHHVKAERALATDAASSTTSTETVRTSSAMEQTISQIKDHIFVKDAKNGVEQVVIRLTPESLGELKVNLKMENQNLKIEIVAQNGATRDALVKHSELLRDTLARQNITMESFDVSTGGNNLSFTQRDQSNWQEFAQQRQIPPWLSSGRYGAAEAVETPRRTLHVVASEHAMVDVHF